MARIADRSAMRASGVCVVLLLAAVLSAPNAYAGRHQDLSTASVAEQPKAVGASSLTSKLGHAADAAAVPRPLAAASCGNVTIAPGSSPAGGYLPLSAFGIPPIAGVGDDTVTSFNVPSFAYAGQPYTQVQVSSNGYVQVGTTAVNSLTNQNFPDPTTPNNVLAPFWTDLNPASAGAVRIGTLTDGADTWIVVDWEGVREFSLANLHSFEVWIGVDSDANPAQDISYAYGSNAGNGDNGLATVGAENPDGSSGAVTFFNGTGTLPSNGTQLRVTHDGVPNASFTATPTSGPEPLHVAFDASASSDDGTIDTYAWDFGDTATGTGVTTSHDYAGGVYAAMLTVTDNDGNSCSTSEEISVTSGFSVDDVTVNEAAGTATFTVSRSGGPAAAVDIAASAGTAHSPADFTAAPTTLNFANGDTAKPYAVTINQDLLDEFKENYMVRLSNPVNGSLADSTGKGTIVDDDPAVRISVNDANIVEGNSGTKNLAFKVSLNRASGKTVKVTLHTADGSARAPGDYVSKTVVVTFTPGQTAKIVNIAVKGDHLREPNETFFVLLNSPVNSTIVDPNGTGGIINDD